jgi:hypothetical protein
LLIWTPRQLIPYISKWTETIEVAADVGDYFQRT